MRKGLIKRLSLVGLVLSVGIPSSFLHAQELVPASTGVAGGTIRFGIGKYVTLLKKEHGWYLWERATPYGKECMVFKVAKGYAWPHFSEGGRPTSSAGYWFFWRTVMPDYQSGGFFGRHWHPRLQIAEVDGAVRTDYSQLKAVKSWDGKQVLFEITTTPYQHIWTDRHEDRGSINFVGFAATMEAFETCKVRLSG